MPIKHIPQKPDEHPELVAEIARVLNEDPNVSPVPGEPDITVEEVKHANSLRITVIWDKWEGIDPEERGRIILDAFGKAEGESEMLRVTLALGVTKKEYCRLQVRST